MVEHPASPATAPTMHAGTAVVGATFDDVLGPAATRYFGHGYRRTGYAVTGARTPSDDVGTHLEARADVHYPTDWSLKGGSGRQPHLSTVDALVLSARVVEVALLQALRLSPSEVARSWLRTLSIRTGAAPVRDLDAVPITCRLVGTESSATGLGTTMAMKVGSFTVDALVDHPQPAGGPDAAVPDPEAPYWHGFRETDHHGSVALVDTERRAIECVTIATAPPGASAGLEGAYGPQPTLIDTLVFAGQMLQILVCATDGRTREESGNLWLRRIRFDSATPRRPARSRPLVEVVEHVTMERDDTLLHSLKARSTALFGTAMSAQIAYADRPE